MDYTQLIERLKDADCEDLMRTSIVEEATEAIEALQARCVALEEVANMAQAGPVLAAKRISEIKAERDSALAKLAALEGQSAIEIDWPEYHASAMGRGLEDRGIRNRYEAMQYGWDQAIKRVAERLPETLYLAAGAAQQLTEAEMFWNHDDAETLYHSIDEFLNDEICNGTPLAVGDTRTIQRAIRLSNIEIRITAVHDEECEADYEVVEAAKGGSV